LAFILRDSGSRVLYVDAGFAPLAAQIRDQAPSLERVVLIGPGDDLPVDARLDEVAASGEPTVVDVHEDDLTVLMYTGGTTGLPKGVLHTQRTNTLNVYPDGLHVQLLHRAQHLLERHPDVPRRRCDGHDGHALQRRHHRDPRGVRPGPPDRRRRAVRGDPTWAWCPR
jgi:acyl-CoA synthetase (AMP-forming)/AMP-acid ligase II